MPKRLTTLRRVVQYAFVVLVLAAWGYYVSRHWQDVLLVWDRSRPSLLTFACLVTLLGYILRGVMWSPLLRGITGISMGVVEAFRVSSIAWMGRYLPGKVWALAGKAYMSADCPANVPVVAVAVTVDILWFQVSGLLLALGCSLAVVEPYGAFRAYLLLGALGLPVGVILCLPGVYCPLANRCLRLLGKPPLPCRPSFGLMAMLLCTNMIAFLLWCLGLTLLLASYTRVSLADFPPLTLTFTLSWVCGFLMLIAPAGIGIRDTLLGLGLKTLLGLDPGAIVVVVLGSRVLTTAVELVCFGIALVIKSPRARSEAATQCEEGSSQMDEHEHQFE